MLQLLDQLECAHRKRFIHCDVRPSNIIRFDNGEVKIADWGLSVTTEASGIVERKDGEVGVPDYVSSQLLRSWWKASTRSTQLVCCYSFLDDLESLAYVFCGLLGMFVTQHRASGLRCSFFIFIEGRVPWLGRPRADLKQLIQTRQDLMKRCAMKLLHLCPS